MNLFWIFIITLLIILAIILILLASIYTYRYIMDRGLVVHGGNDEKTYYHGSLKKYDILKPQYSDYAGNALFAIDSYDDAAIFSAGLTDYEMAMWGSRNTVDDKITYQRYLEEQYPGSFERLNTISYIHYMHGDFKPLGKGLPNEYITDKEVIPYKVDEINVLEYIKNSNIIVNEYQQFLERRKNAPKVDLLPEIIDRVICCIGMADPHVFDTKTITSKLKNKKVKVILIEEFNRNDKSDNLFVIIGDTLLGAKKYDFPKPHYYLKQNFKQLVTNFENRKRKSKTPVPNYIKYLDAKEKLYSDCEQLTLKQAIKVINDLSKK